MAGTLYLCEASGSRILRVGTGIAQVGTDYQLDFTTWDLVPAGEVGDCAFRSIDVAGRCTNGYSLGITPIVDGVALREQTFSGSGTREFQAQAFIAARGTRIAARVRTLSRSGAIEIHNVSAAVLPLRRFP